MMYSNIGLTCCETLPLKIGFFSCWFRIGGILCPYVNMLSDFWTPLPLIIYGGLATAGGFLALLLPETLGRPCLYMQLSCFFFFFKNWFSSRIWWSCSISVFKCFQITIPFYRKNKKLFIKQRLIHWVQENESYDVDKIVKRDTFCKDLLKLNKLYNSLQSSKIKPFQVKKMWLLFFFKNHGQNGLVFFCKILRDFPFL